MFDIFTDPHKDAIDIRYPIKLTHARELMDKRYNKFANWLIAYGRKLSYGREYTHTERYTPLSLLAALFAERHLKIYYTREEGDYSSPTTIEEMGRIRIGFEAVRAVDGVKIEERMLTESVDATDDLYSLIKGLFECDELPLKSIRLKTSPNAKTVFNEDERTFEIQALSKELEGKRLGLYSGDKDLTLVCTLDDEYQNGDITKNGAVLRQLAVYLDALNEDYDDSLITPMVNFPPKVITFLTSLPDAVGGKEVWNTLSERRDEDFEEALGRVIGPMMLGDLIRNLGLSEWVKVDAFTETTRPVPKAASFLEPRRYEMAINKTIPTTKTT